MTTLDRTFTTHKVALPAELCAQIGKQSGDDVTVHLDERIPPTPKRSTL